MRFSMSFTMLSLLLSFTALCISASVSPLDHQKTGRLSYATYRNGYYSKFNYQDTAPSQIPEVTDESITEEPLPHGTTGLGSHTVDVPRPDGPFLGRVETETSAFRAMCQACCSGHKSSIGVFIYFFRECDCQLRTPPNPPRDCPRGTSLGFAGNPSTCFRTRCQQMLREAYFACRCYV